MLGETMMMMTTCGALQTTQEREREAKNGWHGASAHFPTSAVAYTSQLFLEER